MDYRLCLCVFRHPSLSRMHTSARDTARENSRDAPNLSRMNTSASCRERFGELSRERREEKRTLLERTLLFSRLWRTLAPNLFSCACVLALLTRDLAHLSSSLALAQDAPSALEQSENTSHASEARMRRDARERERRDSANAISRISRVALAPSALENALTLEKGVFRHTRHTSKAQP